MGTKKHILSIIHIEKNHQASSSSLIKYIHFNLDVSVTSLEIAYDGDFESVSNSAEDKIFIA